MNSWNEILCFDYNFIEIDILYGWLFSYQLITIKSALMQTMVSQRMTLSKQMMTTITDTLMCYQDTMC